MSRHHRAAKYTNYNQEIRKIIRAALPLPCRRCGRIIEPGDRFDAGHVHGLGHGGDPRDITNFAPEHPHCNRSAGGKAGARASQKKKRMPPTTWGLR